MKRTDVIVIGGGHAGLAMSRHLADRGIGHAILERGRVAERWRSERWDSLHLLTPRWQSRLPHWSYRGPDPDGFMTSSEVVEYLDGYSRSFSAPVHTGVTVSAVERDGAGFRVETTAGVWHAGNVVIATGHCDRASVPPAAAALAPDIAQIVPTRYRRPGQLPDGPVLMVGASATGVQLASEIHRSGRPVTLAVGGHTRTPRQYRGRDIMAWLDEMGVLSEATSEVRDLEASRAEPSLQFDRRRWPSLPRPRRPAAAGRAHRRAHARRLGPARGARRRSGRLDRSRGGEDAPPPRPRGRVHRSERTGRGLPRGRPASPGARATERRARSTWPPPASAPSCGPPGTAATIRGSACRSWISRGELQHEGGITAEPGLYALGLYFMRRRNSSFLDGVGADAADLAEHIEHRLARRPRAAA